jgi:hypothetical protein
MGKVKLNAVLARIEELSGLATRLDADVACPPPPDHVRVTGRQRCACDLCAARAATERALVALRSLAARHAEGALPTDDSRWMGLQ